MSLNGNEQQQIHELLLRQMEVYEQALPLAEKLAEGYHATANQQSELATLNEWMEQASRDNRQMQALLPSDFSANDLDPAIRVSASRLGDNISRMIQCFDAMEQQARQLQSTLAPELDESLRARQMKAAYSSPDS